MHKLPVGGGFIGLVFAVGSALIFILGFPTLWYFVAFAFALGVGVAILLRFVRRHQSESNKPLSILSSSAKIQAQVAHPREKRRNFFHLLAKLGWV